MKKLIAVIAAVAFWVPSLAWSASIGEAKLGKAVIDREISEETSMFTLDDTAYLWMRVVDGAGENITVTWNHGELSFPVILSIGSSSWRTWSSKVLYLPGQWSVTVTDSAGATLYETTMTVQ